MKTITALVFENYETLDLIGPIEIFGSLKEYYRVQFASLAGGVVKNHHGVELLTNNTDNLLFGTDILLIVGGQGTRQLVEDKLFLEVLKKLSENAQWVLSVCTGSALLAKSGLLEGKQATSNKRSWQWVISQSNQVNWIQEARWVIDDKFYTSSGVSAGIDMTLGFIADRHDLETARKIAKEIEYNWQENSQIDNFWDVF